MSYLAGLWLALAATTACSSPLALSTAVPDEDPEARCKPPARGALPIDLAPAFGQDRFGVPVDVVWAPHDPSHAYVVEAAGLVVRGDPSQSGSTPFLDVRHYLRRNTGEIGLWDIAFHPRYPDVPYVYAYLSGNGGDNDFRSLLVRFTTADGGETIDPASERILLSIERIPGGEHQGGKIGFGLDGMLWISTGDGDGYGDPYNRAQDPYSLLGKMLRIDVDGGGDAPYAIPADNPFFEGEGAPEVYALGFRNPWRWSFDRLTGEVWLGDVGHERFEEIDRVIVGGNYGWKPRTIRAAAAWSAASCTAAGASPSSTGTTCSATTRPAGSGSSPTARRC